MLAQLHELFPVAQVWLQPPRHRVTNPYSYSARNFLGGGEVTCLIFPSQTLRFIFRIEVINWSLVYSYKSRNKVVQVSLNRLRRLADVSARSAFWASDNTSSTHHQHILCQNRTCILPTDSAMKSADSRQSLMTSLISALSSLRAVDGRLQRWAREPSQDDFMHLNSASV